MLATALTLYKLCAPPRSNYTMFAKSVYAIVIKVLGKMHKTITVAKEVIEETGWLTSINKKKSGVICFIFLSEQLVGHRKHNSFVIKMIEFFL